MATIRQWLNDKNFDWEKGVIIYQETLEFEYKPYADGVYIDASHAILDEEFSDGFGGDCAPYVFARDRDAIYVIATYDGSTWLEKIMIDPGMYTGTKSDPIPHIGC